MSHLPGQGHYHIGHELMADNPPRRTARSPEKS